MFSLEPLNYQAVIVVGEFIFDLDCDCDSISETLMIGATLRRISL